MNSRTREHARPKPQRLRFVAMTADPPLAAVRAELNPEFRQFAIGTGDVLTAAEHLTAHRSGTVL